MRWPVRHLLEEPSKTTQPIGHIYRRLWRDAWVHKGIMVLAGMCVLLDSLLNLVIPQLVRVTIDTVIPQQAFGALWWVVVGILGTAAGLGILAYLRSYLMSLVGQRVIFTLRNRLYEHLQSLSMRFFDSRRTGELMSRVTSDVGSLQQLITSGVMEIITDFLTFVAIVVLLLWTDWQLTLLLLCTFPLMILTTRRFGQHIRGAYRKVQQTIADVNDHLQQTISAVRLVKSFANEKYEIDRFQEQNRRSMEANLKAVRLWSIFFPIIDVMNHLGTVVVIAFGARQVMLGRLSLGSLVAFLSYLQQLHRPIRRFGRIMNVVQQGAASAERIFDILDTEPDVTEKPGAIQLPPVRGHVEFENVTFSYDGQHDAVSGLTLSIRPGMTLALVGPSGAGKSTVASLLMRFYDPDQGRITIDGHDIRDVTLESLRSQMGVVSQEIILLSGTVRENIAYGRPEASFDEIVEAAKAANAHEFITAFPKGYETEIGERGVRLSGGQRQRIAIARALLKDPRILILDEATSQLDSESEHLIQEALARLLKGRTSLVIAHRLSTIQSADLIVVMERGKILEMGTHEELLARSGRYAALHAVQFRRDGPSGRGDALAGRARSKSSS